MKKMILSALFLALFPTFGWGNESVNKNCTAKNPRYCPFERPYLTEEIHLDYVNPPLLKELNEHLYFLALMTSIPEHPVNAEPCDTKKLCEKVKEIKDYQTKIIQENKKYKNISDELDEFLIKS